MLEQRLQNRQPDALRGIGVVLAVVLAAMAGSAVCTRLEPRIGTLASLLFIAYGCLIAWFLLNWFVMSYIYTANADCLRLCRSYGKRERFIADIWFNKVFAYGTPEELKRRYPGARTMRVTRRQCPFEPLALAWRDGDRQRIVVLQPDEAMRSHIIAAIRGGKKKQPVQEGEAHVH